MQSFFINQDTPWEILGDGVKRKVMTWTDNLMMVCVHFDKGAIGTPHTHSDHDQIAYVVSGKFEVEIAGVKAILLAGDAFCAAKNEMHGVIALEDNSVLIDTFTPKRSDFLEQH